MNVLKSLALAFACFTRIPMPKVDWDADNMRFMMMWLPFVGVVVGAFVALWCVIADAAGLGDVLRAIGIALVPLAVTGGFHLDGFIDVVDALSSHADPAKKRQILKDSHVGAFAVMWTAAYLLAYVGLASELPRDWQPILLLALVPVMSRCGSAFASTRFWGNGTDGTLTQFRDTADVYAAIAVAAIVFVAAAIAATATLPVAGLAMVLVEAVLLAWLNWFARKNFGGMSGDVAGFFLQLCELLLLAGIVVGVKVAGL